MNSRGQGFLTALLAGLSLVVLAGCTGRGITITTEPPGAEVSINHRVVGKTPIRVGFEHYGAYRLELRKRGYETLIKEADIKPAAYGYDPGAFVADNLIPARLDDEVYLHYVLKPAVTETDKVSLMERAEQARWGNVTHPKTGERYTVVLNREPPKITTTEAPAASPAPNPPAAPAVAVATDKKPAPAVEPETPKPVGLRIARQLGLAPEEAEQNSQFVSPESEKKRPEQAALRIKKDEELIYDEPRTEGKSKK